jgi:hypothetical protein
MEDVSRSAGPVLLLALIAAGIGVFMGGGAILYSGYVIIGTIVIIAACIGATWSALQLRNSLTLTGNTLIVCTATKTHKIPFQQVTYVSAGVYGIYIRTSDGLRSTSLVAENSRWSQRFGLKTKASGIVGVISDAIGAGHQEAAAGPVPGAAPPVPGAAGPAPGAASPASAVPGHVPAVTGEVAAPPGRAPAGRLAKTIRVSALMSALGAACLIGGCAAIGAQADSAAALLAHGARARGTVTDVSTFHMDVRYVRDGKPATARINLNDSSDAYHKGDHVTVIYDPAHPDRARTIREDGQNQGSVLIMVVLLVAGAFLLIGGISNLIRARRQLPSGVRAISLLRIHGRAS